MRAVSSPTSTIAPRLTAKIGAAALLAGITLTPIAAQAGAKNGNHEYRSKTVYYGDLNLETEAGIKRFERRITYAARNVCSPAPQSNLTSRMDYRQCMDAALDSGREAMLEIVYAARNGEQLASNSIAINR